MLTATRRRLDEELNIDAELQFVYKFRYQAKYDDNGSEHELCHVFLGRTGADVRPNREEIAAVRFVAPDVLSDELEKSPEAFTPWFKLEWQALTTAYADALAAYQPTKR